MRVCPLSLFVLRSACGASGEWEEALNLFREMEAKRIPRNTISYNAAIQACANGAQTNYDGRAWQAALALFDGMPKACVPRDHITYNAVVRACENGGQDTLALDLRLEGARAFPPPQ